MRHKEALLRSIGAAKCKEHHKIYDGKHDKICGHGEATEGI